MSVSPTRPTYHHGDLRNALIAAGAQLAEVGGPDAVSVRAAARAVGVSPTAAYRHFENAAELVHAVKDHAFQTLLDAMEADLAQVPAADDPGQTAERRLEALGRAYVKVALAEPGLFRVAFSERGALPDDWTVTPLALVSQVMDELVAAGRMRADQRPLAEFAAWASVHGLARLVLDGPLSKLPEEALNALMRRVALMTVHGLAERPAEGAP